MKRNCVYIDPADAERRAESIARVVAVLIRQRTQYLANFADELEALVREHEAPAPRLRLVGAVT